jgi:hypothetical protein
MAEPDAGVPADRDDGVDLDELIEPATEDLEAPPEDAFEQALPANPEDLPEHPHVPIEADEADAYEQATQADPSHQPERPHIPFEANEADAYEQAQVVDIEDDYR